MGIWFVLFYNIFLQKIVCCTWCYVTASRIFTEEPPLCCVQECHLRHPTSHLPQTQQRFLKLRWVANISLNINSYSFLPIPCVPWPWRRGFKKIPFVRTYIQSGFFPPSCLSPPSVIAVFPIHIHFVPYSLFINFKPYPTLFFGPCLPHQTQFPTTMDIALLVVAVVIACVGLALFFFVVQRIPYAVSRS